MKLPCTFISIGHGGTWLTFLKERKKPLASTAAVFCAHSNISPFYLSCSISVISFWSILSHHLISSRKKKSYTEDNLHPQTHVTKRACQKVKIKRNRNSRLAQNTSFPFVFVCSYIKNFSNCNLSQTFSLGSARNV